MGQDALAKDYTAILDDYAPAEEAPPEEEDLELIRKNMEEFFDKAFEARSAFERDWEHYRLWLKGEIFSTWKHKDTGEVIRLSTEDSQKLQSQMNVLRPTARSLVGKLTRTIPTCTVLPATADFDEQHGAKVGRAVLKWARRKERLDVKYVEANEFLPWAGNAFLELSWDKNAGDKLAYCEVCDFNDMDVNLIGQPCPQCQQQRLMEQQTRELEYQAVKTEAQTRLLQDFPDELDPRPEMVEQAGDMVEQPELKQGGAMGLDQEPAPLQEIRAGDFRVIVRDVRDVFPEAGVETLDECRVIIIRQTMSVTDARREFPEWAEYIRPEDDIHAERTAELRYDSMDSQSQSEYLKEHVNVYTAYEKPSELYPEGRVIYKINDRIVRVLDPSPYHVLDRWYPLYRLGFDKNCGEFWYEPFICQAWHRQKEVNNIETIFRERTELERKPKLLNPMGSRITEDEITAETSQIIKFNAAAGKPDFLQWPRIDPELAQRRMDLVADVRMQANVTEQEAGISPSDPNGRAMAIIEAEADQQMGPILVRNHDEWRELHRGILQLYQAYAHPGSKFSIPGPDGVQTFSFEELVLKPGWDIQVEQEDGLARNPTIRIQQALDLKNTAPELFMDMTTGQPDPKKFARYAQINVNDAGYDLEATERAAASRIPYLIKQGQQPQPMPEDDPMIFAEELLGWLRGPGRREDPQFTQQVRQVWMYYASWAATGQPPNDLMAMMGQQMGPGLGAQQMGPGSPMGQGPSQPGQDMSAPGGSTNNPGRMPTDATPSIGGQAGKQVQQADRQGEGLARTQQRHEG